MSNSFDFIVYGATLEGLLIAEYLKNNGLKIAVLESSQKPQLGQWDLYKALDTENMAEINNILEVFNLRSEKSEIPCLTFEKGHFEPFVGFGEIAPTYSDLFKPFLSGSKLTIQNNASDLLTRFKDLDIRFGLTLTNIEFEASSIKNITLNDNHVYTAENFIFAVNPAEYIDLLDTTVVSQKTLQKIGRAEFMSSLVLTLTHKPTNDQINTNYMLYGTTKDPVISVGHFKETESNWITFISPESTDINEAGVQALKEMKRQIKRALPNLFSNVEFEKIALFQASHGYIDLKSDASYKLDNIKNLCICSHFLIAGANPVMKSLQTAYEIRNLLANFIEKTPINTENSFETMLDA